MSKPLILIDPGHGGIDPRTGIYVTPGKRSPKWPDMPQIFEGVFNRDIARRLGKLLKGKGIPFQYIVHPDNWQDVPLGERTRKANAIRAKHGECLYLSIHANGHSNPAAHGLETFSFSGAQDSIRPNQVFFDHLSHALKELAPRGAKTANFHVLRETKMPSVLVEIGFMTNPHNARHMNQPQFRQRAARALLSAISKLYPTLGGGSLPLVPLALAGLGLLSISALLIFNPKIL
ncbi:MAG: N-acetylmuramoyl-L-alanine amidase [Bacteroidota bacterium]